MRVQHVHWRPVKSVLFLLVFIPLLLGWVYQDTNGIDAAYQGGVAYVQAGEYEMGLGLLDFYLENTPEGEKHASASYYRAKAFAGLKDQAKATAVLQMILNKYPASMEAELSRCELDKHGSG